MFGASLMMKRPNLFRMSCEFPPPWRAFWVALAMTWEYLELGERFDHQHTVDIYMYIYIVCIYIYIHIYIYHKYLFTRVYIIYIYILYTHTHYVSNHPEVYRTWIITYGMFKDIPILVQNVWHFPFFKPTPGWLYMYIICIYIYTYIYICIYIYTLCSTQ